MLQGAATIHKILQNKIQNNLQDAFIIIHDTYFQMCIVLQFLAGWLLESVVSCT